MAQVFAPAVEPPTKLGDYRLLSPRCGLRVSPLCLGGMSFGNAWTDIFGVGMTKEETFELLDAYWEAGGNFIDTANNYQDEQSEMWIGEWMKARGNRDDLVIATKFSIGYRKHRGGSPKQHVQTTGNHKKSLLTSLRDSLAKLQTDYVDILYVHWWDYTVGIPELMRALDDVVRSGKVLHLGISDTPAWIVSQANQYARDHALTPFVVYQGEWSCMKRDFERDILPMCAHEGMGVAPWGVIAGGRFRTQKQLEERLKEGGLRNGANDLTENEKKMSAALEKVAKEIGGDASLVNVAISYCLHKQPYVFPILGGRKVSHLKENIKALSINLTREQIDELDSALPFDIGFPQTMLGGDPALTPDGRSRNWLLNASSKLQFVKAPQPIE